MPGIVVPQPFVRLHSGFCRNHEIRRHVARGVIEYEALVACFPRRPRFPETLAGVAHVLDARRDALGNAGKVVLPGQPHADKFSRDRAKIGEGLGDRPDRPKGLLFQVRELTGQFR